MLHFRPNLSETHGMVNTQKNPPAEKRPYTT